MTAPLAEADDEIVDHGFDLGGNLLSCGLLAAPVVEQTIDVACERMPNGE